MIFRLLLRKFLQGRGYTHHQAKRLVSKLDWGRVREIIRTYGPTLLKIFLALLPLIMAEEAPHTMHRAEPGSEEEDYNIPFAENDLSALAISEELPPPFDLLASQDQS